MRMAFSAGCDDMATQLFFQLMELKRQNKEGSCDVDTNNGGDVDNTLQ